MAGMSQTAQHTGSADSNRPNSQDERWARKVAAYQRDSAPPFEEQWAAFQEIFHNRKAEDGPPVAWRLDPTAIPATNLGQVMAELGYRDYREFHTWSIADRAGFWEKVIDRLSIVFTRRPNRIADLSGDPRSPQWLPGARLNITDSCFGAPPESTAIVSGREGSEELARTSYRDLEELSGRMARYVQDHTGPEAAIGLYMPMTLECVVAYLGIVRAGRRVVSIADSFSPEELQKRMEIADASLVVTSAGYQWSGKVMRPYDKVRQAEIPRAIVITGVGESKPLRDQDTPWETVLATTNEFTSSPADPYDVINILFSSGTTGVPKAIPWTHLTPIKCAMDGHFHQDINSQDTVAWPTNIGWMMGPWLIYATLMNKATMALYEGAPTGAGFAGFIVDAEVSVLGVVPSLVRAWRRASALGHTDWSGVRVFSSTGEPSNQEDYLWLMSRTGYRAPVIEYLGGTEIGGGHITGTVVQPASPSTFTTPALGIDFVILDEEGKEVADGAEGELFLIPPAIGLSQTLLNKDHDPVYYDGCPTGPNGEVLRRHGDRIAQLHQGFLKGAGRADDAMNLGGIKVSSAELEQVIDRHPAVYESAAIAIQPEGQGADRLVVYAALHEPVDAAELKRELGSLIASQLNPLFKLHELIVIDALPRTPSNKIIRRELRARYRKG